jgi:hypothetical protein
MTTPFEQGAVCLGAYGITTASWLRYPPEKRARYQSYQPLITINRSDQADEGAYFPPASIQVSGVEALRALRAAIDEALKYEAGQS